MKLPKTVTQDLYFNLTPYGDVQIHDHDMEGQEGWVTLGKSEITLDVPQITENEITNKKVSCLRGGREKVVEEFTTKLANIDEQLNELLALPNLKSV